MSETFQDTYKTIAQKGPEVLFKDKGSKFFGYIFPIEQEDEVKEILKEIKTEHYAARHWCYAWRLGQEKERIRHRANDDGEPSGTAGQPIYNQLLSADVTNVLLVVVRYFGGIKLGVSGLINAYKTSAQYALEEAEIVERVIEVPYVAKFAYSEMNTVMRIVKEQQLNIKNQVMEMDCLLYIALRKSQVEAAERAFGLLHKVQFEAQE